MCAQCGADIIRSRLPCGEWMASSVFLKRKYCSKACAAAALSGPRMLPVPSHGTAHKYARLAKPEGSCERCGSNVNVDVHHKDEDWRNNKLTNLERLCRPCHTKHHRQSAKAKRLMCGV